MSTCVKQTTKKYTSRPGPPYPANECKGQTKKGNDGKLYISETNTKGVARWKLIKDDTPTPKKPVHHMTSSKKYHNLLFLEPSIVSDSMYKKKSKKITFGADLKVNDEFYKVLLRKPKARFCSLGNAYIFGPKYAFDDYMHIGSMGNDVAQTGLVDMDIMMTKESNERLGNYDLWKKAYPKVFKRGAVGRWDDREGLNNIRTVLPEVVFVGDTHGGDVGADLWAHKNADGDIDGLIIDINCIFPHEE